MARLPRAVVWLVHRVVPRDRADTVVADLESDYATASARRAARWWLARESSSLLLSYVTAWFARARDMFPIWVRDAQLVVRGLRRGQLATLASAGLLAVGLAAVLLAAGLADALLFRSVSTTHPDTLRRIVAADRDGRLVTRFAFVELENFRQQLQGIADVAAVYLQPVVLRTSNTDVQTMVEVVEGPYFPLTGMTTVLGRGLMTQDHLVGGPPVAVVAASLWRRHLGAAPTIVGATIRLNGASYVVVGVVDAAGSSSFLGAGVDAWVPLAQADPLLNAGWRSNLNDRWFTPFALPRRSAAELEQRLQVASADLSQAFPDPWRERTLRTTDAMAMIGSQRTAAATLAAVLFGLSALILLAAGSNVSGVLLARAVVSTRSAAIHLSMGAGRLAIARRQLLEGALLGVVAGAGAIALYVWARVVLAEVAVLPTLAFRLSLPLDGRVILLAMGGGVAAGVLLALGPALWTMRRDVADALRHSGERHGGSPRLSWVRRVLVSAQVALSLVLIVGATLFSRSLDALLDADIGFARERLVAMDFDVEPPGLDPGSMARLGREVLTRVGALPGIEAVAMSNRAPIDQSTPALDVSLPGTKAATVAEVTMYLATERYFETVGVPLVAGRSFTATETSTQADVVIVNQALATRLWPDASALEQALYLPLEQRTVRVVGVARDSKYRTLTESARPHIYRPTPAALGLSLLARTTGDPREGLRLIQRELDDIGPGLVGFFPRTLDDHLAVQLLPTRAAGGAATALGTLALLLSAASLYALMSWFVLLRGRELSVRMALGAAPHQVRRLIVRQALGAAIPGLVVGILLTVALGVVARSALFGVSPYDPVALGVGIAVLLSVVLIAGYLPSIRATTIDPGTSLWH
jgi:putative ABC transport system permease protein